jgi:hypothetical protein
MTISLGLLGIVYPDGFVEGTAYASTSRAIFGYGATSTTTSMTNLISNLGGVSADVTGVGTARARLTAASYGGDKAIFGYGSYGAVYSITNLVSSIGVVSTNVTGVGTARGAPAAAGYGSDKAIFGFGDDGVTSTRYNMTNLVSNTGVVGTDVAGVGTARGELAAATFGLDKAIFAFGTPSNGAGTDVSVSNLVSNTGVVATDTAGIGTVRRRLAAAGYGGDKAIFGYGGNSQSNGSAMSMTNLVSNLGVVASDVTGVGTQRTDPGAAMYGGDKGIFIYGISTSSSFISAKNLVSNIGVVAVDEFCAGTARRPAGAGFGA